MNLMETTMNAILFAAAFAGVLAAAASTELSAEPNQSQFYSPEMALNTHASEPFMARGELQDPVVGDWSVSVIGGAD